MNAVFVASLSLALVSTTALANPVYQVIADETHACSLRSDLGCKDFSKGFRFEATNWQPGATEVGGTTLAVEGSSASRESYVFAGKDVAPVLDAQGNMTEPTCQWPTGGVMQHAVTDAQGRLYIKRVEVVTKCVNGKMTTIQRAIN